MNQDIPKSDEAQHQAQDSCKQCGTCCQKGGPAFHLEDRELLEKGKIGMSDVYTIREGEPIYDNVKGTLDYAETDIIKMKGEGRSWACRFLEADSSSCRIYEDRPLECRVLKCWDTREIEVVYARDRLTRKDLVSGVDGLWDLIEEHQQRCSYFDIRKWLEQNSGNLVGDAVDMVLEMIKYDLAIRPMMVEKGQLDAEMMDFLLGRPMIETITLFGLTIEKDEDGYRFSSNQQSKQ